MSGPPSDAPEPATIGDLFRDAAMVAAALDRAAEEAVSRHRRLGQSIVVWRDGRSVTTLADDIEVPNRPDLSTPADSSTSAA